MVQASHDSTLIDNESFQIYSMYVHTYVHVYVCMCVCVQGQL